jgi:hypothetical protein
LLWPWPPKQPERVRSGSSTAEAELTCLLRLPLVACTQAGVQLTHKLLFNLDYRRDHVKGLLRGAGT